MRTRFTRDWFPPPSKCDDSQAGSAWPFGLRATRQIACDWWRVWSLPCCQLLIPDTRRLPSQTLRGRVGMAHQGSDLEVAQSCAVRTVSQGFEERVACDLKRPVTLVIIGRSPGDTPRELACVPATGQLFCHPVQSPASLPQSSSCSLSDRSRPAPPHPHPPPGDNRQPRCSLIWRNLWHPSGIPGTMQEIPPQIPTPIP